MPGLGTHALHRSRCNLIPRGKKVALLTVQGTKFRSRFPYRTAAILLYFDVSPSIEVQVVGEFRRRDHNLQAFSPFCGKEHPKAQAVVVLAWLALWKATLQPIQFFAWQSAIPVQNATSTEV